MCSPGCQAQQQINAQQFAEGISKESPKEDVAKLLKMVQQELATLDLPEEKKEEVAIELKAAEVQVKKDAPDKAKVADRLKSATDVLKEVVTLVPQAVAVGNMIGKAILWCGDQWVQWGM
jgi:hypothetical protein